MASCANNENPGHEDKHYRVANIYVGGERLCMTMAFNPLCDVDIICTSTCEQLKLPTEPCRTIVNHLQVNPESQSQLIATRIARNVVWYFDYGNGVRSFTADFLVADTNKFNAIVGSVTIAKYGFMSLTNVPASAMPE